MRKQPLVTDEYYHIYNRGVDKRDIFNDKNDLKRFVESICEFKGAYGKDRPCREKSSPKESHSKISDQKSFIFSK